MNKMSVVQMMCAVAHGPHDRVHAMSELVQSGYDYGHVTETFAATETETEALDGLLAESLRESA